MKNTNVKSYIAYLILAAAAFALIVFASVQRSKTDSAYAPPHPQEQVEQRPNTPVPQPAPVPEPVVRPEEPAPVPAPVLNAEQRRALSDLLQAMIALEQVSYWNADSETWGKPVERLVGAFRMVNLTSPHLTDLPEHQETARLVEACQFLTIVFGMLELGIRQERETPVGDRLSMFRTIEILQPFGAVVFGEAPNRIGDVRETAREVHRTLLREIRAKQDFYAPLLR